MAIDTTNLARQLFAETCQQFGLEFFEQTDEPVELSIVVPEQVGLKHRLWLCLQNYDELCFGVGEFYCYWFPCTENSIAEKFKVSLCGYLSGDYRIIEWYRGTRFIKAELQAPVGDDWKKVYRHSSLSLWPFPWEKRRNELRNT